MTTPVDYPGVARLLNQYYAEPTSVDKLVDEDRKIPRNNSLRLDENRMLTGFGRIRLVAADREGRPVGYGQLWRGTWTNGGDVKQTLVVEKNYRRRGIGQAIYGKLVEWADKEGASTITEHTNDNDPPSIRFAETRGFTKERHTFQSILQTDQFRRDDLFHVVHQVEDAGIRFITLCDLTEQEGARMLYEITARTVPDIPGSTDSIQDFDEWAKWNVHLPAFKPEFGILAMDGDHVVGVAHLLENAETRGLYHEYTGVDGSYRGRHIALALKLLAIRTARRAGAPYLKTHNDATNAAIDKFCRTCHNLCS